MTYVTLKISKIEQKLLINVGLVMDIFQFDLNTFLLSIFLSMIVFGGKGNKIINEKIKFYFSIQKVFFPCSHFYDFGKKGIFCKADPIRISLLESSKKIVNI